LTSEFLPRAHSRKLGELDVSNWKKLESKRNLARVDPAIREVVSLLNAKGYTTFSSCSGGHSANLRRRFDRHESGYLAFSPPSKVAFTLYDSLHRANLDFGFEAQAVVDNGAGTGMETICTRLYWQLLDEKPAKQQYYAALFRDLRQIIERLPSKPTDYRGLLAGVLGRGRLPAGLIIVKRQMKRFTAR